MATRFADHLLTGTHASRPSGTAVPAGSLYSCTTHGLIYQSDGTTWTTYATLGATETLGATIIDAKGDLIGGTAADTAARLAVGTNAQVLTADSAETTGMKWATPSAGAAGAVTLLSSTTLGSAASFDISSISGSYNDLICVLIGRSSSGTSAQPAWRFNGDSGSNYSKQQIQAVAATATASEGINSSAIQAGRHSSSASAANSFAAVEVTIYGYASTTWTKVAEWRSAQLEAASTGGVYMNHGIGFWNNTAAINRIQVYSGTLSTFVTGSQLRIYGRL